MNDSNMTALLILCCLAAGFVFAQYFALLKLKDIAAEFEKIRKVLEKREES
jgi:hypothetical protein